MSVIVQISWLELSCFTYAAVSWVPIDVVNAMMNVSIEEVVALINYGIHYIQYLLKNTWNYLETQHFIIWKLNVNQFNRTPVIIISKSFSRNRIIRTDTKWFPDVNRIHHQHLQQNAKTMKCFQISIGYRLFQQVEIILFSKINIALHVMVSIRSVI